MEDSIHANVPEGSSSCILRAAVHHSDRNACGVARAGCRRGFDHDCSAADTGVRAAALPALKDIFGRPATGRMAARLLLDSRRLGCSSARRIPLDSRLLGICRRPIRLASRDTGDRTSDSTAELITDSATAASASSADAGKAGASCTTPRRGTWAPVSTACTKIARLSTKRRVQPRQLQRTRRHRAAVRPPKNAAGRTRSMSDARRRRSRISGMPRASIAAIMRR